MISSLRHANLINLLKIMNSHHQKANKTKNLWQLFGQSCFQKFYEIFTDYLHK